LKAQGKNPFILDSKEPNSDAFRDFINTETRYTSLAKMFPEQAEELFAQAKENSIARYQSYAEQANK
jgi:pyruvate-ferredoxin/flavodoxin oxidoreductase